MTAPPTVDTVQATPTGRYLQNIDLPEQLTDLFPSKRTPPRIIASKGRPDKYMRVRLGFYPLGNSGVELEYRTVHANALIHTSVSP